MRKILGISMMALALGLFLGFSAETDAQQKGKGGKGKGGGFGDPEASFKKLDTNSDGKLSKEEFLKSADRITDEEKATKFRETLGKAFDKAATDGSLTLEQYKEARTQMFGGGRKKGGEKKADDTK